MEGSPLTGDYTNCFQPLAYLRTYYSDANGDPTEGDFLPTTLRFLHEAFSDNNISGKRLLDVGSGPSLHSVISVAPHVDSVFLSDFAPQNREVLARWVQGTLDHSFQDIFRYVVDLEDNGVSPTTRETLLRQQISGIIPVDVLQGEPLKPSFFPQFDIITSSLCIESVCKDLETYACAARNLSTLLVNGGFLALVGMLGITYYMVGGERFWCLGVDSQSVKRIWQETGFRVVCWKESSHSAPDKKSNTNFNGYFLMLAQKTN